MKKPRLSQDGTRGIKKSANVAVGESVQAWWDRAFDTEMDIVNWPGFVISNQQRFWDAAGGRCTGGWDLVGRWISRRKDAIAVPRPVLLEFTRVDLHWSPSVSNTHSCPHNGMMNWGSMSGLPHGYPGWHGHMEWQVAWPRELEYLTLGSDLFGGYRQTRVHTGCGGGGNMQHDPRYGCTVQTFGREVRIYAADWPGIARVELARQTQEVLVGDRSGIDVALQDLMQSIQVAESTTTTRSTGND